MNQEIRSEVLKLMEKKDKIEDEIKQLTDILHLNGVGMNDPLVDAEGFPINSIDIYQVRHARNRIICLQNDHKALMKEIENGLHGYYSSSTTSINNDIDMQQRHDTTIHKMPFAKINIVSEDSPAQLAGLNVDDEVVEFGTINKTNFTNLTDIATVVQHSEGKPLHVKVRRGDGYFSTNLRPKKWKGRGLLGCNIIPLNYALRRIRDTFKENKKITDSNTLDSYFAEAQKNLEVLQRQVLISHMYSTDKLVIEHVNANKR